MSEAIIIALISFAGSVIVAIISYVANHQGAKEAAETNAKLLDYRLGQLEDKVNKHNNLVERMALAEQDRKTIWRKIDELAKEVTA